MERGLGGVPFLIMAATYHLPVTAAQVGAYFVGQYYQALQQQPEVVHQFYSETSTMLRVDGTTRETATAMLQIHAIVMSLNFTGIEIKTAHSLESWSGGVLIMVTGSVLMKDMREKRAFVQTFFLAPQEKGYFVLNDIFQFIEEEPFHRHPAALFAQNNFDSRLNASAAVPEPIPNYMMAGEMQAREFVAPTDVEDEGTIDEYVFPEQQLPQAPEAEDTFESNCIEEANGSVQNKMNNIHEPPQAAVEEPVGEPQKQTYASILRVAKGQSSPSVAPHPSINKSTPPVSELHPGPQLNSQQQPTSHHPVVSAISNGGSGADATEEVLMTEDEGEIKSVYVRNLLPSASASEIEEEFKNFGKIKPDGVVIRSRKDLGVCYAFVEFEDITGVHNAVKAATVQIAGRPVYIEERRATSNSSSRGGRRGRGRGSYHNDAPTRGHHYGTRNFSRGSAQDGGDWDYYNRPRGNGLHRQSHRHDRGFSRNQLLRNGQNPSELSS